MKIALVRRTCITHLDGVNRFIALLAEGLIKLGHDVEIFGWCYRGVERELEKWFKEIHGLDTLIPIRTLVNQPCKGDPWIKIAVDWYFKGSRILRNEYFDAVIANGVVPLRFSPKIAVNHGITLKTNRFNLAMAKMLYRHYDKVICVSRKLRDEVKGVLDVDCEVIPLPMKLELYKTKELSEREDIVVHIGTRPVKNPQISIETIKILRRRGHSIRLIIMGPPTTLPANEGVEYKYNIPESEKIELLCKTKALILPSSYEALPYVVLEAMACGTPVVVSNAVPEEIVASNFNGIRVNSFNPEDYANTLEKLLKHEELWLKLSRNSLEFARQFEYIGVAKKYIDIIHGLL